MPVKSARILDCVVWYNTFTAALSNRALTSLNVSSNNLRAEGGKALADALKDNKIVKELKIASNNLVYDSNNNPDMSGVIAISDTIPTMGAMATVNVMGNLMGKEQLAKLQEMLKVHPTLVSLCGIAEDATKADLSGLYMDADDAVILAAELPAKGALTSLDISANNIGDLVPLQTLPEGWSGPNQYGNYDGPGGTFAKAPPGSKPEGVIAIADAIKNNGALVKFDISNNALKALGGVALAEALKDNNVMTNLNLAGNMLGIKQDSNYTSDMAGVIAIGDAIPTMRAMTSLNMSKNKLLTKEAGKVLGDMLKAKSVLKELNVSGSGEGMARSERDGPGFAKELADGISANRALATLNILNNDVGETGAELLEGAWKSHKTLKTICGASDELDLAGKLRNDLPVVIVELKNNGAMTSLNISWNDIKAEGAKHIAAALPECK